jgi:hypothetical protein
MNSHLITIYLLVEAHDHPQGQIAEALQGVLTDEMRRYAGTDPALIDWAIAGDDIASAIAQARFSPIVRAAGRRFPSGQEGRSDVDHASASGSARTLGKDTS